MTAVMPQNGDPEDRFIGVVKKVVGKRLQWNPPQPTFGKVVSGRMPDDCADRILHFLEKPVGQLGAHSSSRPLAHLRNQAGDVAGLGFEGGLDAVPFQCPGVDWTKMQPSCHQSNQPGAPSA
jgi:hypothetical protein